MWDREKTIHSLIGFGKKQTQPTKPSRPNERAEESAEGRIRGGKENWKINEE